MTNDEQLLRTWIDTATYEQLLSRWRHAPSGDNIFEGDVGTYFATTMAEKKSILSNEHQVQISKQIGW